MNNNVRLYPWYFSLSSFLAWMPVFFLYFSAYLDLSEVLRLEAVYYVAVVVLEVPSGYFSDALGRKKTLVLGALFLCLAVVLYLMGSDFITFIIAQVCFAAHMSFVSGTNTVFLYESLTAQQKEDQYGKHEASATKWSLLSGGLAALIGGYLASSDLSLAYWVSLLGAVPALIITLLFQEPVRHEGRKHLTHFGRQLTKVMNYLYNPQIALIFGFYVLMFILVHVPYEFYQPYLDMLEMGGMLSYSSAPTMSGFLYAVSMWISAIAAARSIRWERRLGLKTYLVAALIFMMVIIGLMGQFLHPLLMIIVLFRSFAWAAVRPSVNAAITPLIGTQERATFHSMMSLVCRLSFFALLFGLSFLIPTDQVTDWPSLSFILKVCLGVGLVLAAPMMILSRKIKID